MTILIGGDAEPLEMGPTPNFTLPVQLPDGRYVQKMIVAGSPPDSPANRVDANIASSPYAGVGSLELAYAGQTYICSATPIHPQYVLSAAHCVDFSEDGVPDISSVNFHLNYDGDFSQSIPGVDWWAHPDYTGFANPSVNDDVSIIKLASPLPAEIPIYELNRNSTVTGQRIEMVGYGRSGDGVNGYSPANASLTVKRMGENITDTGGVDDEGGSAVEVWEADFDGPTSATNYTGGLTLGNDIEATIGGGDSGGPSFIPDGNGGLKIFGINTYSFRFNFFSPTWPYFGSGLGGMAVAQYVDWIDSIVPTGPSISVTPTAGLLTTEAGGTDTFEVSLSQAPATGTSVTVSISMPPESADEGAVDKTSLTFTDGDWGPQTVTVTGLDDNEWDRDVDYTIVLTATSSDSAFDGIDPDDVSVTNRDNEIQIIDDNDDGSDPRFNATYGGSPNWSYSPTGGIPFPGYQEDISYAIGGGGANVASWTFTDLEPGATYDVSATWTAPHGTDNRASDSPFEIDNGTSSPQIRVNQELAPHPDHVESGVPFQSLSSSVTIGSGGTLVVRLSDEADEYVIADAVRIERLEDSAVIIDRSGGSTGSTDVSEGGATGSYEVMLSTQPTANVTISLAADGELTVAPTTLEFTTSNWNQPQEVTISAVDDSDVEGNHTGSITHTAVSNDAAYDSTRSIDVNITDNDLADSFEVSEWNGLWVEDSQNDWFRSTQRATDGSYSAEVDGRATDATLTLNDALDISGFSSADLTFDWLIESGFDNNEFLWLDISRDGGLTWTQDVRRLRGNSDPENVWHTETIELIGEGFTSERLKIQFRSTVSRSNEDANVDNVRLVGVPIGPVNQPPVAVDDSDTTDEDTSVTTDVVTNDTDSDGTIVPSTVVIGTGPTNGALVNHGDGTVTYTPSTNYFGTDSYTYTVKDDGGAISNVATVTITVNDVNDPPVANNDSDTTTKDTAVTTTVVTNDTDVDGTIVPSTVVIGTGPTNGALVNHGDGTVTYTPNTDYVGTDSYTYTVNDDDGGVSNVATVTITVNDASVMHVGDLDAVGVKESKGRWRGEVTVTVHDSADGAVEGAMVTGTFTQNGIDIPAEGATGQDGTVDLNSGIFPSKNGSATFTVNSITHASLSYDSTSNHDPDGGNGTSITLTKGGTTTASNASSAASPELDDASLQFQLVPSEAPLLVELASDLPMPVDTLPEVQKAKDKSETRKPEELREARLVDSALLTLLDDGFDDLENFAAKTL